MDHSSSDKDALHRQQESRKSAQQEVAFELEHKDRYAAKYTLQSALLLVPFAMFILAVYQETMGEHK